MNRRISRFHHPPEFLLNNIPQLPGVGGIQLADGNYLRLGGQHRAEFAQLPVQHQKVSRRIRRQAVNQMDVRPRPFRVAQKLVAQANAAVRPFQQPGDFHHHKILAAMSHRPQHGFHRSEGIIGHLGPGRGAAGNQRGLAGIGLGQQPHIGQQLELQPQHAVLPLAARLGQHRFLVSRGHEPGVAPTALAAAGRQRRLPRCNVGQKIPAAVPVHPPDHGA